MNFKQNKPILGLPGLLDWRFLVTVAVLAAIWFVGLLMGRAGY